MKISVLVENHAGGHFAAEHGLSYLIEVHGNKFLFDTGHTDLFLRNAHMMGLDIDNEIHTVMLSHGHWDHGDGLRYLNGKTLVCHPSSFRQRFHKGSSNNIGLSMTLDELTHKFEIQTYKEAKEIFHDVFFLGEIPRITEFESKSTLFELENGAPDFVQDDSALAIRYKQELVIISGCAHSGIVNIVEYARQVTGINKIKAVIGGFHLKHQSKQAWRTLEFFKENRPEILIPSHCTELPALTLFHQEFGCNLLKTGDILDI